MALGDPITSSAGHHWATRHGRSTGRSTHFAPWPHPNARGRYDTDVMVASAQDNIRQHLPTLSKCDNHVVAMQTSVSTMVQALWQVRETWSQHLQSVTKWCWHGVCISVVHERDTGADDRPTGPRTGQGQATRAGMGRPRGGGRRVVRAGLEPVSRGASSGGGRIPRRTLQKKG